VLIDATLKEDFPPISLPKREYMENAKAIWEELGLPKLKPEAPWFGYSLGEWSDDLDAAAARATAGDYFETAKLLEKRRRKDVGMNTEVRNVDERASGKSAGAKSAGAKPRRKPKTR
jgi:4-hydroxy-3-polyprenylbenzoate decarboxylase